MSGIVIVGLGPGAAEDLTVGAWDILNRASEVWLRTLHHPMVKDLPSGLVLHSFDEAYEQADQFADVYQQITAQVLDLGSREEGVVYAVPGHPLVGESTVTRLLSSAAARGIEVRVVHGLSFVEPALTALGIDALEGLQIWDALDFLALNHPPLNPDLPALIAQVYSRAVASELKLVLMNQYGDEHPTALIDGAGTSEESIQYLPLYEIDRHPVSALSTLYVAPIPGVAGLEGFQETIARLRSPEGCPWDREQTHESLRTNLLEECYEVLDAIDAGSPSSLQEELGDLLLQIVLHAQIAVEEGEFGMPQVISQIDAKLKRRHPHVWADVNVGGVDDVITNWEAIKQQERDANGTPERSLLGGIPGALPALAQAAAYTDRAGRIGFERVAADGIWVDLPEAVAAKLTDLLDAFQPQAGTVDQLLGDILFVISDWARRQNVDLESLLREANQRFAKRFSVLEQAARDSGTSVATLSDAEIRRLWKEAGVA